MTLEKIAQKILVKVAAGEPAGGPDQDKPKKRTWMELFKDYRPLITDTLEEGTEMAIRFSARQKGAK